MNRIVSSTVLAAIAAVFSSQARAGVPVYAPSYDPVGGNGYQNYPGQDAFPTGLTAGDGDSFGSGLKIVNGTPTNGRPILFTTTTTTEYALPAYGSTGTLSGVLTAHNAAGVSAGSEQRSEISNQYVGGQALRWDAAGNPSVLQDVLTGGDAHGSSVRALNAAGTAVGYSTTSVKDSYGAYQTNDDRPVRWAAGTTAATPLDIMGLNASGHTIGITFGITTAGTTYGAVEKYVGGVDLGFRAVRWDAGGTALTELGHLGAAADGSVSESPIAANDMGVVVGHAAIYSSTGQQIGYRPTRWNADGTATALDVASDVGGTPSNNSLSEAVAVNAAGTAVGQYATQATGFSGLRPARWDAGSSALTQLGVLGTVTANASIWASAINDAGIAVGTQRANINGPDGIALMWGTDGVAIDLNTLIDPASNWKLVQATSITNGGWITGIGLYDPDGAGSQSAYYETFLIQVPEPTTLAVLGVAAVALLRRRPA